MRGLRLKPIYKIYYHYYKIRLWKYISISKLSHKKWKNVRPFAQRVYHKPYKIRLRYRFGRYLCHSRKLKVKKLYSYRFMNKQIFFKYLTKYKNKTFKTIFLKKYKLIERRLDYALYETNFVTSFQAAKFFICKGFIFVKKIQITNPIYLLHTNDLVEIKPYFYQKFITTKFKLKKLTYYKYHRKFEIDYKTYSFIFLKSSKYYILKFNKFIKYKNRYHFKRHHHKKKLKLFKYYTKRKRITNFLTPKMKRNRRHRLGFPKFRKKYFLYFSKLYHDYLLFNNKHDISIYRHHFSKRKVLVFMSFFYHQYFSFFNKKLLSSQLIELKLIYLNNLNLMKIDNKLSKINFVINTLTNPLYILPIDKKTTKFKLKKKTKRMFAHTRSQYSRLEAPLQLKPILFLHKSGSNHSYSFYTYSRYKKSYKNLNKRWLYLKKKHNLRFYHTNLKYRKKRSFKRSSKHFHRHSIKYYKYCKKLPFKVLTYFNVYLRLIISKKYKNKCKTTKFKYRKCYKKYQNKICYNMNHYNAQKKLKKVNRFYSKLHKKIFIYKYYNIRYMGNFTSIYTINYFHFKLTLRYNMNKFATRAFDWRKNRLFREFCKQYIYNRKGRRVQIVHKYYKCSSKTRRLPRYYRHANLVYSKIKYFNFNKTKNYLKLNLNKKYNHYLNLNKTITKFFPIKVSLNYTLVAFTSFIPHDKDFYLKYPHQIWLHTCSLKAYKITSFFKYTNKNQYNNSRFNVFLKRILKYKAFFPTKYNIRTLIFTKKGHIQNNNSLISKQYNFKTNLLHNTTFNDSIFLIDLFYKFTLRKLKFKTLINSSSILKTSTINTICQQRKIYLYYSQKYKKYTLIKYLFKKYIFHEYKLLVFKTSHQKITTNVLYFETMLYNLLFTKLYKASNLNKFLKKPTYLYSHKLQIIINYFNLIKRYYH